MEWALPCRTAHGGQKLTLGFFSVLLHFATVQGEMPHSRTTLSVSAPYLHYTCPEGATVKLLCASRGSTLHPSDILRHGWLFTPHMDQHCTGHMGPRHIDTASHDHHSAHTHIPPGLHFGAAEPNFWVALENVTKADEGRYCCTVTDFHVEQKHFSIMQRLHSHVFLQVTSRHNGSQICTFSNPESPAGSGPVALAVVACVLALLSLPLILVLVYKQRQNTHSSRRAQELVRMDSEALGHENPVFLGGSPQIKTRTVSQIMTRQSSETGRHLLSEPGTPLSPPVQGDVFFPIEDTIIESPEFLQA